MKYCPTCGKVVPRGHGFKSDQKYCSYDCYRFKTPISALEKQIPKKPKQYTDYFKMTYYFCPICEYVRITGNQKRCDVCGQKIDWEVV